jgi:hypothetical protein
MNTEESGYSEQQEVAQYEKLASRTKELIENARELTSDAIDVAIDKAKDELAAAGEFSREQGERLKAFLRRDLKATREHVSGTRAGSQAQRVASGIEGVLAGILARLGHLLQEWAAKVEDHLRYRTGEVTSPGTLTCVECESKIRMKKTGRVPPCPKCHAAEFRRP